MKFFALALLALALLFAGCGAKVIKDDAVIKALNLSQLKKDGAYTVNGDPFCQIRNTILITPQEIHRAGKGKAASKLLVTNPAGTVGVIGMTPFDSTCRTQVEQGMQTVR